MSSDIVASNGNSSEAKFDLVSPAGCNETERGQQERDCTEHSPLCRFFVLLCLQMMAALEKKGMNHAVLLANQEKIMSQQAVQQEKVEALHQLTLTLVKKMDSALALQGDVSAIKDSLKTVLSNQATIESNQSALKEIKSNQQLIVRNQAKLDEIVDNQKKTIVINQEKIIGNQRDILGKVAALKGN